MPQRPDILIVTTDQQRTDTLSCYGAGYTHTPHIDRLARDGIRCDRAYCANPVCTPARVSLFTGLQVNRHGSWNIGTHTRESLTTLADRLAGEGYRTHYVGKIHFQPWHGPPDQSREHAFAVGPGMRKPPLLDPDDREPPYAGPYYGFQTIEWSSGHTINGMTGHYGRWLRDHQGVSRETFQAWQQAASRSESPFGGEARDWALPTACHQSTWAAERAIAFLDGQPDDEPFCLAIGFQDPHHPHALPEDFEDRVDPADVPVPTVSEDALAQKPPHYRLAHRGEADTRGDPDRPLDNRLMGQLGGFDYSAVSEHDLREARAYYYSMMRLIDREWGRILAKLEARGQLDNTLIIFTSDHGELLGDHGLWLKGPFPLEPLIRVPLLLHWPAGLPGRTVLTDIISHVDLAGIIAEAAGLALPADAHDGCVTLDALRTGTSGRTDALVECVDNLRDLRLKTLVTPDRKLTWYQDRDYGELYHLDTDPGEALNRWDDPGCAEEKARLLGRLLGRLEPLEAANRSPRPGPA
ncbi:MAG: sulfatase family protein [Opitutales bacterium]